MALGIYSKKRRGYRPLAEMNMTPFIDVMMVLLIVFMVAAPLMTVGIKVDLPETSASDLSDTTEPLVITINKDQKIYLQETQLLLVELVPKLIEITKNNPQQRIFIRGDQSLSYGRVMDIMGQLTSAGFTRVALVAEIPEGS